MAASGGETGDLAFAAIMGCHYCSRSRSKFLCIQFNYLAGEADSRRFQRLTPNLHYTKILSDRQDRPGAMISRFRRRNAADLS
jgi:hypothetical protein